MSYLARIASGDARWMTALNNPGSLANVGMLAIVYSLYGFMNNKEKRYRYLFLFLGCITLIFFDGSRTCLLAAALGVLFCSVLIIGNKKSKKKLLKSICVYIIIVFAALGLSFIFFNLSDIINKLPFRYHLLLQDSTRASMAQAALQAINNNPIIGDGMYSLAVEENGRAVDVHMTYLEVWAEFGLMAFMAFLFLVFSWLIKIKLVLHNIGIADDVNLKALGYNAIFLLFFFAFHSLFHPLSNEWSEWILVLIPAGIYWQFTRIKILRSYE